MNLESPLLNFFPQLKTLKALSPCFPRRFLPMTHPPFLNLFYLFMYYLINILAILTIFIKYLGIINYRDNIKYFETLIISILLIPIAKTINNFRLSVFKSSCCTSFIIAKAKIKECCKFTFNFSKKQNYEK